MWIRHGKKGEVENTHGRKEILFPGSSPSFSPKFAYDLDHAPRRRDILNKGSTCWREKKRELCRPDARIPFRERGMDSKRMKYSRIFSGSIDPCETLREQDLGNYFPMGADHYARPTFALLLDFRSMRA